MNATEEIGKGEIGACRNLPGKELGLVESAGESA
jgi:hypothetical protein